MGHPLAVLLTLDCNVGSVGHTVRSVWLAGLTAVARVDMILRHFSWYPAGRYHSSKLSLLRPDRSRLRYGLVVAVPGDGDPRTAGVCPTREDGLAALHRTLRLHLYLHPPRGETDSQLEALDNRLLGSFVPGGAVISFSIVRPISSNWYLGTDKSTTLGFFNFSSFHFLVTSKPLEFRKRIARQSSTLYPPDRSLPENLALFVASNTQLIRWIWSGINSISRANDKY